MSREVILFHPRTFHEKNYRYFYVPYSLLSVAASLDRSRFNLRLLDNNVEAVEDWRPWLAELDEPPLCVGISSMIGNQISDGISFAEAVQEVFPGVPRVWGGALPTVLPELTAAHSAVDVAVVGQGQQTFADVLDALAENRPVRDLPGVAVMTADGPRRAAARAFADWDGFPPFRNCYDLIDGHRYIRYDEHINSRTINYHSSQGCPFSCGFCSEVALWGRRWTGVGVDRILADIEHLVEHLGVNGIKFYDAEFFIKRNRAQEFASRVVDRGLPIQWAASVHPRNIDRLNDDELSLLARSGVSRLLMGAESGVQEELDLIGKRTSRELLVRTARRCSEHGIVASFSFVTGYPGFPMSHIDQTLEFAAELHDLGPEHEAKVHFYAPYPGTPLYQRALDCGFVPPSNLDEWAGYDYYYITTPWIDPSYERPVREFNESSYPYLHPSPEGPDRSPSVRVCPIIQ
ncbi:B12-binding domain-containing radical SAM protein [Frankia gtarii]|uniref:B12-binding domain-containing radical SAM protein n=1 Tax=Frankia gtarii TaxID=2950102 RepID=UPI0021BF182A|nr:radical SAM protein [Frankia gtarii]